jgi:hypothetical protein
MKIIKGDIIEIFKSKEFNCLLQQCNCQGNHGAGVAKAISRNFPEMVKNEKSPQIFGDYFSYEQWEGCHIVNLYGQYYLGKPTNRRLPNSDFRDNLHTRLLHLKRSLDKFKLDFDSRNSILMPFIASGLAKKADYSYLSDKKYFELFVKPIIEETLEGYDINVVEYG